jgi:puromycin-sensitive aminopeptidase
MGLGKNFRLPEDVRPTRYRADLAPDLEQGRFEGRMDIELALARPRREIVLHGIELQVDRAELRAGGKTLAPERIEPDAESQTISLRFGEEIPKGAATLQIAWKGSFSPGLRGLYRAGPVAVTQFEAADARRVFPCFDEPAFKARWAVNLSRVPPKAAAIGNGAIEKDQEGGGGAGAPCASPRRRSSPAISSRSASAS